MNPNPNIRQRPRERPIKVSRAYSQVRSIVANWAGRTLRIHHTTDLQVAERGLTFYEAELSDHSPHAVRLLTALRAELARPERQPAA
jgi:hypothetical protein